MLSNSEQVTVRATTGSFLDEHAKILICPKCGGSLTCSHEFVACLVCGARYEIVDGIPLLFWKNEWASNQKDVTEEIKAFYEENPFPNYDDFDDVYGLMQKARQGIFARLLDEQIPMGARILECGCGTGQLSVFLSVAQRTVLGTDMCLNSLRLGQAFKQRHGLDRVQFMQMNIFAPIFKPESFDLVISNGVLHHTADPFLAFQTIARLVRPGGYILIGLYHKYGRLLTDFRRSIFRISKNGFRFLDPRLTDRSIGRTKRETWFADQYRNPHESKHTIGEVQGWFERTGFSFVRSIPRTALGRSFTGREQLFVPERPGNQFERVLVELMMTFTNTQHGGFFVTIGKKRGTTD